jgi:hypothetical protein
MSVNEVVPVAAKRTLQIVITREAAGTFKIGTMGLDGHVGCTLETYRAGSAIRACLILLRLIPKICRI